MVTRRIISQCSSIKMILHLYFMLHALSERYV